LDTSAKKIQRANRHLKDAQQSMPLGNCKLKGQRESTTDLSIWPKFKTQTQKLSFMAGRNAN
jgi:hypothetical protein